MVATRPRPRQVARAFRLAGSDRHHDKVARGRRPEMRARIRQATTVTALSGSGPAYFFFLVEAMIDAGILLGLPRQVAADLIVQSAFGAARMLRESSDHPVLSAGGGHVTGGHDDRGHPRAGAARGAGSPDRCDRGGPRPVGRARPHDPYPLSDRAAQPSGPNGPPSGAPLRSRDHEDPGLGRSRIPGATESGDRMPSEPPELHLGGGAVPDRRRGRDHDAGVEDDGVPARARGRPASGSGRALVSGARGAVQDYLRGAFWTSAEAVAGARPMAGTHGAGASITAGIGTRLWRRIPSGVSTSRRRGYAGTGPTTVNFEGCRMGSVVKKRRKRMAKKKHRKLLRKTRVQRRRLGK